MNKDIVAAEVNAEYLKGLIYQIRGIRVMLDADLAKIYGYSTKDFNRQVKNNIEKFEQDFMFQLTDEECEILRCKNSTSSWGGRRYNPHAFTEQGIYMLMTVLKGDRAIQQSKALIRLFKQMKDYIVDNQSLLGQREYLQLSLQTTENTRDLLDLRKSLSAVDDKVANIIDTLGNVVTKSELANIMLDFSNPAIRRGWLILNGQPVESDAAYQQIYNLAKKTIFVVDNYIGLKTLVLLKDVPDNVNITIFSDNTGNRLHRAEFKDFCREYPNVNVSLHTSGGIFHDRYIVIDYKTPDEKIFHCGSSSKDGGSKVTTITAVADGAIYHQVIDLLLNNPVLTL
ncbi:MAG: ORF6N domain-containing protein [Prevotella sp.]|nr:ORF6N domain-containing protein [Prevotella sp.]